ncbi:AAA-ATPase ASD, mitochondrial-like [Momordica charantia]|uniref:AAA-ATPase ASD, mitochondrial-like n=1 Tax=Momordica charantia TaxID=3673 RepID=A0A6J1C6W7_MOMCH|nr:AAA-ATPase ASD, mitochondrial-like [Momordica charantia]
MYLLFSSLKNISSSQEHLHQNATSGMWLGAASMAGSWVAAGPSIASFMFAWAMIQQYCPQAVLRFFKKYWRRLTNYFHPYIQISVHEFVGERLKRSEAFVAIESYLSKNSSQSAKRLKAEIGKDSTNLVLSMDDHEKVTDEFQGVKVWWVLNTTGSPSNSNNSYPSPDRRYYSLTFHKRHRDLITEPYLKHVLNEGKEIRVRNRQRKLYTNGSGGRWSYMHTMWSHIVFEHPATFDTIAMEAEKKQEIIDDLLTFTSSKDFYSRIGKAWKRGYLLYGPPGTGKSTMIAAMANLLNYDIYDLELTAVKNNTELRKLLIETTSKSIIVIEDIDCSLDLTGQRKKKEEKSKDDEKDKPPRESSKKEDEDTSSKVTLSGLLNFIDGIWSACGGERLIVFTTNYVEKLDPALIRTGRMDKHVELTYCSFEAFQVLARNYLNLETHPLFDQIKELFQDVKITPADVAENLMPKSPKDDTEKRLHKLIQTLEGLKNAAAIGESQEVHSAGSTN